MRLTLYSDFALRTLIFLAVADERGATIPEIAAAYAISENHLPLRAIITGMLAQVSTLFKFEGLSHKPCSFFFSLTDSEPEVIINVKSIHLKLNSYKQMQWQRGFNGKEIWSTINFSNPHCFFTIRSILGLCQLYGISVTSWRLYLHC